MQGISTIQDIESLEAEGLPKDLPESTYQMIQQGARINPKAPALSFFLRMEEQHKPMTWTYNTLMEKIHQTANAFRALGVARGDTVAFVLPNLPETHLTIWGAETAGRVASFNPLLEGKALGELIAATQAKVLVCLGPFPGTDIWQKLASHVQNIPSLKHVVWVNLANHVRGVKHWPAKALGFKARVEIHGLSAPLPRRIQLHDFNKLISKYNKRRLNFDDLPKASDVSSCFCTGGTTGLPKIALREHGNEVFNAWSAGQFIGSGMNRYKNVLCGLPLFHVNGVLVTGLLPFSKGAHVILAGPQGYRTPGVIPGFWKLVEHHKIHFFSGVPTLFAALLDVPIADHNVSTLEYGLCGAAPMPAEVMKQFQTRTGLKILEGYGLTEGTCVSSVNPPLGERRIGSIGLRIPFQAMKAVVLKDSGEHERDCLDGEAGQIVIHGPNVFRGYSVESQNTGLWVNCKDGKRWLNTGDMGRRDSDGYFYLTGRKKELIIRGGHNIDPKLIEDALHQHPAVHMAAAVGRPDAYAGELPVAYVELKAGQSATSEELLAFAKNTMAERAAIPKHIVVMRALPLTGVGKIFKPALKHLEIEDVVKETLHRAHVALTQVGVVDHKSLGTVVELQLQHKEQAGLATEALGALPIQIHIKD
ncbi:MAG TPA: acyl-CoA synthetase [Limnobacter sp.]|nr:acyl-CoA synthetase [Limnobacter sp.]